MACGAPFTIGIGFDDQQNDLVERGTRLSLRFHERDGEQRLLGKIGLRFFSSLRVGTKQLCLFRVRDYKNYCLPKVQLWARHLQYARQRRRVPDSDVPITPREVHAMIVFYICPRPVVLVSVADGGTGNVFPMNLMGSIGNEYFAFALNSTRAVAPLVERAGRVALSSVPVEQASLAYQLGGNHRKPRIDWNQLPFPSRMSTAIGIPVPAFALRVREMQVEATRKVGSHTLFAARTIGDERWADGTQFFVVHGMYQAWRQKMNRALPAFPSAVEA
jgi:flavin reductase (DIM6/NTAB) family NADH-FMN oxidoreductase RutF